MAGPKQGFPQEETREARDSSPKIKTFEQMEEIRAATS